MGGDWGCGRGARQRPVTQWLAFLPRRWESGGLHSAADPAPPQAVRSAAHRERGEAPGLGAGRPASSWNSSSEALARRSPRLSAYVFLRLPGPVPRH